MNPLDYSAQDYVGTTLQTADTFGQKSAPTSLQTDVVIIGAGPSGLVAAAILAEAGLDVIILEGGRFWPRGSFKRKQSWAAKNLMQEQGSRVMMGNAFIPVTSGRGVGGGTLVNSAICFRAPDHVLDEWVQDWGLDYFSKDNRDALYTEIEKSIGVAPTPQGIAGQNSLIARRGFQRMGIKSDFMPRNAPACGGCGTCQTGCPTGAKASSDLNWLPRALRAGARLFADTRAEHIDVRDHRARGVQATLYHPETRSPLAELHIQADRVLVAAGAINSPMLLQRQDLANSSRQVGKNLRVHPTSAVLARFEEDVRLWSGVTQGYFAYHPDDPEILLETFSTTADLFLSQVARVGVDDAGDFLRNFRHLAACGLLIRDSSSGQVQPGEGHAAKISYRINKKDINKITAGLHTIAEMFHSAGSRAIMPMVHGTRFFPSLNSAQEQIRKTTSPGDFFLYSSHPMGTIRAGADKNRAVVRPTDGQTYDIEALHVIDSSLFPTSMGANPQVTIMAQALSLSRNIAKL